MRTEATDRELAEIAEATGMKLTWIEAVARRIRSGDVVPTGELVDAIARRALLRKDALALAERAVIVAETRGASAYPAEGAGLQVVEVLDVPGLES